MDYRIAHIIPTSTWILLLIIAGVNSFYIIKFITKVSFLFPPKFYRWGDVRELVWVYRDLMNELGAGEGIQ